MRISDSMGKVVHEARELGWIPDERNKTARRHFYFNHPTIQESFSIFVLPHKNGEMFTVGHQTSSSPESAIGWLEELSKAEVDRRSGRR